MKRHSRSSLQIGVMLLCGVFVSGCCKGSDSKPRPEEQASQVHQATKAKDERVFTFHYETTVEAPPKGKGPVEVFVPLAVSDQHQTVLSRKITASIPGEVGTEPRFKNEFWHGRLERSEGAPITVSVDYEVRRMVYTSPAHAKNQGAKGAETLSPAEREQYLKADALVPVSGKLIDRIKRDLPKTDGTPLAKAQAIYNYVVDTMEYKKVGTGWGNGDTHWACSKRYGNCTDFHALFISLARSEGLPARFEIGFPVDDTKPKGDIGGYHCWALFHVDGLGWIPVDASDAKKHPEKRELLFGTQPFDRIKFTEGRDIKLSAAQKSKPLNYFIYPHVEVKGVRYDKLKNTFRFEQVVQIAAR